MALNIKENVPLAPLTTFKIGGAALYYTEAHTASDVTEAIEYAKAHQVPAFVFGGGSNVLFSDKGFPGLIIHLVASGVQINGEQVTVFSGTRLLDLVVAVEEKGLAGLEYLSGVPGFVGGAIRGNAGAFGSEISTWLTSVTAVNLREGIVKTFTKEECVFAYRKSFFKENKDWVIVEAKFLFKEKKSSDELARIRKETIAKREAKHPQDARCAGSFFMNPYVTNQELLDEFASETGTPSKDGKLPAGWLVTHVGLRGKKIGGAEMSAQHPNYLVNTGDATAEDVVMLSSLVKTKVRDELGIRLQEEVQMVGF
jgi:UDP-N-acetylmuramate dehydrogenase